MAIMKPWDRQKGLASAGDIPTQKEILAIAARFKEPQQTVLFLLSYLTAGRVSEVMALKGIDIEPQEKNGRNIVLIHLPNRKNRDRHFKDIPIPMDRELEAAMIQPVLKYILDRPGPLFDFKTTARAWQILKMVGFNPHWLRHIRLTHLETIYGISSERLRVFAGWTDGRPAKHYIELNYGDLLDGF